MAYTKKLEIKINGSMIEWQVDPENGIKIKDQTGFELTSGQLEKVRELLTHIINICNQCPDLKSLEYSNI